MTTYTIQNITRASWQARDVTWAQVQALATVRAAERLEQACLKLDGIISRLDSLGRDGLHEVIIDMARTVRERKKRRLARRRAARKARAAT